MKHRIVASLYVFLAFWFSLPACDIVNAGVSSAVQADTKSASFKAECGGTQFEVQVHNDGHPLSNTYQLFGRPLAAQPEASAKLVYTSAVGGWFYAACMPATSGPMLLFQAFCGGSACVEDKYGIVDVKTLKVLLSPGKANVSNAKKAKALLGMPLPYLPDDKRSFCCDNGNEQ